MMSGTATGSGTTRSSVVSSPSCPASLEPKHITLPSSRGTQVCPARPALPPSATPRSQSRSSGAPSPEAPSGPMTGAGLNVQLIANPASHATEARLTEQSFGGVVETMLQTFFTPDHDIFRKSFRDFVQKELAPHADEWEKAELFPREVFLRMGKLGFLGAGYTEDVGGGGGDYWYNVVYG